MPYVEFGLRNVSNKQSKKIPILQPKLPIKPIFSNNSFIYYKPGSLSVGGSGTVSNSGAKSRRT